MDIVAKIIEFETGSMDDQDIIEFFQELIDTDMAWKLQGMYGRAAQRMIDSGYCHKKGA